MANRSPLAGMKCMKKKSYESKEVAENMVSSMDNGHKQTQRVYKCRNCQAWHTSTKRGKWLKS